MAEAIHPERHHRPDHRRVGPLHHRLVSGRDGSRGAVHVRRHRDDLHRLVAVATQPAAGCHAVVRTAAARRWHLPAPSAADPRLLRGEAPRRGHGPRRRSGPTRGGVQGAQRHHDVARLVSE